MVIGIQTISETTFADQQVAAATAWDLVTEDIFIVVDKNLKVVFANFERLTQLLYGSDGKDLLERAIDLWSFYCPLALPETSRHVVDRFICRIHPELDPSKATVETLPNAKLAVAHYGCWAQKVDPHGRNIWRTKDSRMSGMVDDQEILRRLWRRFSKAVLGKNSSIIRFSVKALDPEYYNECLEIFENLPDDAKIPVDSEDWISLFALGINGYTQRHKDVKDIQGGLAGLLTFGRYKGANLCIPALGLKVKYEPGACAIIRGCGLDHLVQDYSGPRYFVIGTNHETCKKHAWRKLGRLPPLPSLPTKSQKTKNCPLIQKDSDTLLKEPEELDCPCVNPGTDAHDEDQFVWTNDDLHGPAVLPLVQSGTEGSSDD